MSRLDRPLSLLDMQAVACLKNDACLACCPKKRPGESDEQFFARVAGDYYTSAEVVQSVLS